MTLSVKGYTKTLTAIGVVTLAILFSALYGALIIHISPVFTTEGNTSYVPEVLYFVSIVSGGCFVWILKTGRKIYKENEIVVREYTHQAYLMALSVYGREGDADLDFYDIARDVFPELKKRGIQGSFFAPAKTILENKILDVNKIHFILAKEPNTNSLIKNIKKLLDEYKNKNDVKNLYAFEDYWKKYAVTNNLDTKEQTTNPDD